MENLTDKEKAQYNEEIFKKYTEKASQDEKFENKKVFKVTTKTTIIAVSIIIIISVIAIGVSNIVSSINDKKEQENQASQNVKVPNLMGKTYSEVKEELEKLGLTVEKCYGSSEDENAIVISQTREGTVLKKGDKVSVTVLTQEEIEEREEKKQKEEQENRNRSKATTTFAETIEKVNNGSVKYQTSTYYGTTDASGAVYQLKYITSYEQQYYYQLVSYNSDYTQVVKYTRLFLFSDYGLGENGEKQELEYAYKSIFDTESITEDDGSTYHRTQEWYDEQKEDTSSTSTSSSSSSQSSSNKSSSSTSTSTSNSSNTTESQYFKVTANINMKQLIENNPTAKRAVDNVKEFPIIHISISDGAGNTGLMYEPLNRANYSEGRQSIPDTITRNISTKAGEKVKFTIEMSSSSEESSSNSVLLTLLDKEMTFDKAGTYEIK